MATQLNIDKVRGDTRRHIFLITDSTGTVADISAWTSFTLAITSDKDPVDTSTLLESINGALVAGSTGRVSFSPAGTLSPGQYYYGAQAFDANNEKITFAQGRYAVTQDRNKA